MGAVRNLHPGVVVADILPERHQHFYVATLQDRNLYLCATLTDKTKLNAATPLILLERQVLKHLKPENTNSIYITL